MTPQPQCPAYIEPSLAPLVIPIDQVKIDPTNVRTHDERNLSAIGKSLEGFRQQKPIVVDADGVCIAGNGTLDAANDLGWSHIAVARTTLTGDAAKAYAIADNRTAELASWDDSLLADTLLKLKDSNEVDHLLAGFKDDDIAELLARINPVEIVEDEALEPPEKPVTQRGDVWIMGDHRVLCGDCTEAGDYRTVLSERKPDAIVTDPPYGVGVEYESFADDEKSVRELITKFMPILLGFDCPVGLTSGHRALWFYPRPVWIMAWVHPAGMGRNPWGFTQFNPILVYGKCPYLASGKGSRPDSIVMAVGREGVTGHPTPKPMKFWCWLVERFSPNSGELILDPFLGSGTTLIACEQLNRICYGIEIEPRYVDVIVSRWQTFTKKQAIRESDGKTFSELH